MTRVNLTAEQIRKFICPADKAQAFLRDSGTPGLGIRATRGAKVFIFQSKLADGSTVRTTIGDVRTWGIDDARKEARRLQILIDQGQDPRQIRREQIEAITAQRELNRLQQIPALEAWRDYIAARRHRWGEAHTRTHEDAAKAGGEARTRGKQGETQQGILRPLLCRPLGEIDAAAVRDWLKRETAERPTRARLAFAILRAFIRWCAEHPDYAPLCNADACSQRTVKQELPAKAARKDALLREHLAPWFTAVRAIRSPVTSAYLQALLLTGARPGELAALRWDDVDFHWRALTIRDKVEGERTIPLTPYVAFLLRHLQAINLAGLENVRQLPGSDGKRATVPAWKPSQWVFRSARANAARHITPNATHDRATAAAGLPPLTLHGLRRSFGSLAEWTETPAGVVAQIMGHKPSATVEKHYRVRPLDLLRSWHSKLEGWILDQAGIEQPADSKEGAALRAVS